MVGNNELYSPWVMPILPPVQMRNRIYLDKYQEFARVTYFWHNFYRE
jgi:hypothetical protein